MTASNVVSVKSLATKEVIIVPITSLFADEEKNSREKIDKNSKEFKELALDIRQNGVLENLVVRENGNKYEVMAGYRRFLACHAQSFVYEGLYYELQVISQIPVQVRDVKGDVGFILINLSENIHKQDLTGFELCRTIWNLEDASKAEKKPLKTDDIAKLIHKSAGYTKNLSKCRDLIPEWKEAFKSGLIRTDEAFKYCYKMPNEQKSAYDGWMNAKTSGKDEDDDLDKKKNKNKDPRMMRRDKVEKFWIDICNCVKNEGSIKISGKWVPCTEEIRKIAKTIIRTVTGEMDYPLKDYTIEEDFSDMDD